MRSWSEEAGRSFDEWLVASLASDKVPRVVADEWLEAGRLVLFLDGFGELEHSRQVVCAHALNRFLKSRPYHGIVVRGRDADLTTAGLLALDAAVILRIS